MRFSTWDPSNSSLGSWAWVLDIHAPEAPVVQLNTHISQLSPGFELVC